MVIELTQANIAETVDNNEMLIIDFWAPWCAPCRRFGPIFEAVALKNPDIKFGKLNTEDQPELAGKFGIQSIPTIGIFKEQELIFLQPGALPEEVFEEVVAKTREINMDEVRAEMAKDEE